MTLWVLDADQAVGGAEEIIKTRRAVIGVPELDNLLRHKDKDALQRAFQQTYPNVSADDAKARVTELWRWVQKVQRNDNVLIKAGSDYLLGQVESGYHYLSESEPAIRHSREIFWRRPALQARDVGPALLARLEPKGFLTEVRPREVEDEVHVIFNKLTQSGWAKDGFVPAGG